MAIIIHEVLSYYFIVGAGSLVVSNSLKFKGINTFSKVLTTLGLEKKPMTLAVFDPTLRKL
jgi:hypothetical protein